MLEIKNTQIFGLERSIVASGNAMTMGPINTTFGPVGEATDKHYSRAEKLGSHAPGQAHDHYLAGIIVQADIKYPLYISPEMQRYHWFEIVCSQSTMHRLSLGIGKGECFNKYVDPKAIALIEEIRLEYEANKTYENMMRLRSNLPWGFEMWMTISTNYLQLKTMYNQRKDHRLKEDWGAFISWCNSLPLFNHLTGCHKKESK